MEEDKNLKEETEEEDEVLEEDTFEREIEGNDKLTVRDAVQAAGEIYGEYKKAYKSASKADKAKFLLIILPFFIGLAIGAVGVTIANIGQSLEIKKIEVAGWIVMGIGFGTTFLTIVVTITVESIKNRKHRWK